MLYIGSDHGGFPLKEELKKAFTERGIVFTDLGPDTLSPYDDYPKFSAAVAGKVAENLAEHKGILLCRSGQGVCIAANKIKGIRAATAWNPETAEASRRDDDANILCLPSDYISTEEALAIVDAWLKTEFAHVERHARRIAEIEELEK